MQTCGGANYDQFSSGDGREQGKQVPGQGDDQFPDLSCHRQIPLPTWLADGDYVLQWALYSMYGSYAVEYRGLYKFHNCADITITGGAPLTQKPAGNCAFTWSPGDRILGLSQPDCSYFNLNTYTSYSSPDDDLLVDQSLVTSGRPAEVDACNGITDLNGGSSSVSNSTAVSNQTTMLVATTLQSGVITTLPAALAPSGQQPLYMCSKAIGTTSIG